MTPYEFELVDVLLFRDNQRYRDPLELEICTRVFIPRGEHVQIPRFMAEEIKRRGLA